MAEGLCHSLITIDINGNMNTSSDMNFVNIININYYHKTIEREKSFSSYGKNMFKSNMAGENLCQTFVDIELKIVSASKCGDE